MRVRRVPRGHPADPRPARGGRRSSGRSRARRSWRRAIEFVLEGLHLHQKLNKDRDGGAVHLPGLRTATANGEAHGRRLRRPLHRVGRHAAGPARSPTRSSSKLGEYLSYTDDVQQALDWLLRQGLDSDRRAGHGPRRASSSSCARRCASATARSTCDDAFDELRERLEELLDLERDTLDELRRPGGARTRASASSLDQLPHAALGGARARCATTTSSTSEARAGFEDLLEELDNIRDLEEFQRRYGELFHGPTSLDYDEAVELMREMERLKRLEEQLCSAAISRRSTSTSCASCSATRPRRSFEHLRQMMLLLTNAGLPDAARGADARSRRRACARSASSRCATSTRGCCATAPAAHADRPPRRSRDPARGDASRTSTATRSTSTWSRTLKQALAREPGTPLALAPDDFEVYDADARDHAPRPCCCST